jgi:hypothetical protein
MPQTMDIIDMAIHRVTCQKSDFHGNSEFPFTKTSKKISGQNVQAFQK